MAPLGLGEAIEARNGPVRLQPVCGSNLSLQSGISTQHPRGRECCWQLKVQAIKKTGMAQARKLKRYVRTCRMSC
jgi:hypothetical protein